MFRQRSGVVCGFDLLVTVDGRNWTRREPSPDAPDSSPDLLVLGPDSLVIGYQTEPPSAEGERVLQPRCRTDLAAGRRTDGRTWYRADGKLLVYSHESKQTFVSTDGGRGFVEAPGRLNGLPVLH